MIVVPILVRIGLRSNGHADHPAWETLPMIAAALPQDPSRERIDQEVRQHMLGSWHYDKTSGHAEETVESPRGQQLGMLFVTRAFADEALTAFPAIISQMTQTECIQFWNQKAMIRLRDQEEESEILLGLRARRDLMVAVGAPAADLAALDARIRKALDPDDIEPGVRRNLMARFASARVRLGVTFHASVLP